MIFQIRAKQEQLQKIKKFLPAEEEAPELEILEKLIEKQVESKIINSDLFGNKDGKQWLLAKFNFEMLTNFDLIIQVLMVPGQSIQICVSTCKTFYQKS